jgi:hypothetical protein
MRQCILRRGCVFQTAWIPAKFAVEGRWLKIRGINGWNVVSAGIFQREVREQRGYFAGGVGR